MTTRQNIRTRFVKFLGWTLITMAFALPVLASDGDGPSEPKSLDVLIRNRLFPDFGEMVTVQMNQKTQVGDTDYFFEIIEFYPHFAVTDSTKQFITLSNELKNPAFRILVTENDSLLQDTWAFFNVTVPHFTKTAYLTFDVRSFEYGGVVHDKYGESGTNGSKEAEKAGGSNQ
jgi:hypothetical protein